MPLVTAAMVRSAIDAAEPEFEWCLNAMAPLGGHRTDPNFAESFMQFQLRLLDAIASIENIFRQIKQEEKRLVARKNSLNSTWFSRRMAKLAIFTKILSRVLAIGRSIGDGFAWFFYEPHRNLIDEHLKHQRQPLLPPRLGALGERLTLKHMLVVDGKLLLYHGITTFLRIGDFSLIDVERMEISAIGEIKTGQQTAGYVQTHLSLVSANPETLPKLSLRKSTTSAEVFSMPPAMADRHKRQMKVMREALASAESNKDDVAAAALSQFHFESLESVTRNCGFNKFEWVQAGEGFVIGAVRLHTKEKKSLGTALLRNGSANVNRLTADAPEWVMKIVGKERRLNSLLLGTLFAEENDFIAPAQSFPVTLWPIPPHLLIDLLLQRVMVITILNPGHLWAKLEHRGFDLTSDKEGNIISASLIEGDRRTELTNLRHYTRMISQFMMTEESIMSLLCQLIELSQSKFDGTPLKIEIHARINRFERSRGKPDRNHADD